MPSKEELLIQLSVKQLREFSKENRVLLVRENPWSFSDKKIPAKNKGEIVEILNASRKVSKKKVEDRVFGSSKKTTSRKGKSTARARKGISHEYKSPHKLIEFFIWESILDKDLVV